MSDIQIAGFRFAGVHAGIKKKGLLDLGLIVADQPAVCAGVYTTNLVVAAPVVQSRARLKADPHVQVVVASSGNANACTGPQGEADTETMARWAAESIDAKPAHVQVASTGCIGAPLPMPAVQAGIAQAAKELSPIGFSRFAEAIMTTDTRVKIRHAVVEIDGRSITVAGCAKGAGMIHPRMATLLGFLVTDAAVDPDALQSMWRRICDRTFNTITVDGDTSTNDTALILASGAAGSVDIGQLESAVSEIASDLAKDLIRDAEGAKKLVAVSVINASSVEAALKVAQTIALSPLVKTAFHGEDPNWGRIIAAAGRSGVKFDPDALVLQMNDVVLFKQGLWAGLDAEKAARAVMQQAEFKVTLSLAEGSSEYTVYTCDLSADYIRINADYRS